MYNVQMIESTRYEIQFLTFAKNPVLDFSNGNGNEELKITWIVNATTQFGKQGK